MSGVFPSLSFTFTSAPASMSREAAFWFPETAETLMSGVQLEPVSVTSTWRAAGSANLGPPLSLRSAPQRLVKRHLFTEVPSLKSRLRKSCLSCAVKVSQRCSERLC